MVSTKVLKIGQIFPEKLIGVQKHVSFGTSSTTEEHMNYQHTQLSHFHETTDLK